MENLNKLATVQLVTMDSDGFLLRSTGKLYVYFENVEIISIPLMYARADFPNNNDEKFQTKVCVTASIMCQ